MFDDINFPVLIYSFAVLFISFTIKGMAGFGDPLLYNPLLGIFYNTNMISPATIPVGFLSNIVMVAKNFKKLNLKLIFPIIVFVLLGDIPGVLLLRYGQPTLLKLLLGIVITGLGIEMLTRKEGKESHVNMPLFCVISFFSGMTAGLFSINLLFVAYLERVLKNRDEFRSSICLVFLCESIVRLILILSVGLINIEVIMLGIISIPAMAMGMLLGGRIDKRIGDILAGRIIKYIFLLGGISTIIYAVLAL